MTTTKGKASSRAKTQTKTKVTTPDPKEISIGIRNKADTEICAQCRGSHYILTNYKGQLQGELCACFNCPECKGRGHVYIEDETGITSLRECVCAGLVHRLKKVGEAGIPGKFASTKLDTYHPIHASQKLHYDRRRISCRISENRNRDCCLWDGRDWAKPIWQYPSLSC